MLKVAITGNISSGKSAVKNILDELHYKTLCLDEVTEFLYNNSAALKSKLKNEFDNDNKSEIAKFIFDDNKKLKTLENIIYPFIKDEMFAFFSENNKEKIIFVVAPMLFKISHITLTSKMSGQSFIKTSPASKMLAQIIVSTLFLAGLILTSP